MLVILLIMSVISSSLLVSLLLTSMNLKRHFSVCETSLKHLTEQTMKTQTLILRENESLMETTKNQASKIRSMFESQAEIRRTNEQTLERLTSLWTAQEALHIKAVETHLAIQAQSQSQIAELLNRLQSHNWSEFVALQQGATAPVHEFDTITYPPNPDDLWVQNHPPQVADAELDEVTHEQLVDALREDYGSVPS